MQNQEIQAVSESFYSLQGEGKTMGIPAIFLRLSGCNLICGGKGAEKDGALHNGATWICDTIDVWMQGQSYPFDELIASMNASFQFVKRLEKGAHLVITGGEPLLQQQRIIHFLTYLEQNHGICPIVEIETNATIEPLAALDARVHYWNCSPKLSNSGMSLQARWKQQVIDWFGNNPKTMFKFVLAAKYEFEEIDEMIRSKQIDASKIVLMPAADSIEQLLERNKMIAQLCIDQQLRMCTRLHVEIWNQLTGV